MSPDGWHEVCPRAILKRAILAAGSGKWDDFAPHLLVCLFFAGIFVTGVTVWRMRARRDRNDRKLPDCEWQAGKGSLAVPSMSVQHTIVHERSTGNGLDNFKEVPYNDEKVSLEDMLKAGTCLLWNSLRGVWKLTR